MGLRFAAKAFDNIIVSTLGREIGLQFLINRFSRSFFSKSFITACLCDILILPFILAYFSVLMKTSSQKELQRDYLR